MVVDDIALPPAAADAADGLHRKVDAKYGTLKGDPTHSLY